MMKELRKMMKNRIWLIVICSALIVSACLAFYGQYDFIFIGTIGFVFFWASVILLFTCFVSIILFTVTKSKKISQVLRRSLILFAACCVLFLSFPIALKLIDYDAEQTKKYCDALILRVENYKTKYGKYPDSIDSLLSKNAKFPAILREYDFYKSTENGTSFEIIVPVIGPTVSWELYDSKNNNWEILDPAAANEKVHKK